MSVFLHRVGLLKPAAGGGPTTALAHEDDATSLASTISVPGGVQTGDLLVLLDRAGNSGGTPGTVIPTGFTSVSNISDGFRRQIASLKIADGTETTLTGMSGDFTIAKALYMFRGDNPISSASAQSVNEQLTNASPGSQSVTASGGTVPLVVIGCYGTLFGPIDPRSFTPAKDGEINPDTTLYLAYKIYNSSPADVAINMDDEGTANGLQSFYIECS